MMKNAAIVARRTAEAESTNNFSPTKTHEAATKKDKEEVDRTYKIGQDCQPSHSIKRSTITHPVESCKSCRKGFSFFLRVFFRVPSWENTLWKICKLTFLFWVS